MKIFGSIKELVSAVFRKDTKEITLQPNSASYASVTTPVIELPPPDSGTVELVGKTSSQTLTNKTIDDDSNTITNIALTGLKTVLADADKALVRDASGVVTSAKIANVNVSDTAAVAYSKLNLANSIVNADISDGTAIVDTKLATISTAGKVANSATTATSSNTASAIVARDASNNFAAGTITASSFSGPLTSSAIVGATSISYAVTTANADSTVTPALDRPIILLNNTVSSTINAVANPAAGKQVFLINDGLPDLTIADNAGGTSGIFTGTGSSFTLKTNASVSLLYSSSQNRWVLSGGAGGSGGGTVLQVSGSTAGLSVGDVMYLNGSTFTKAQADAASTAEAVGVISKTLVGSYELTLAGVVTKPAWGLTPGGVYFLSPSTAGAITLTEPSTIGQVSVPIGVAQDATNLIVSIKRGVVVGGTNARTQLPLSSGGTATVFDAESPTLYPAGELTGWIELGTTAKFYFRAPFARNAASNNWNISPSYVGDTPPAGFSITMDSDGDVIVTCPAFSGVGLVNYALNAPAVGATFPLAVDAGSITAGTVAEARLPSTYSGLLTLNGGIKLPTTGGTADTLDFYETGSFTANFNTGMNTNTNNYTINFTRLGNIVFLRFPDMRVSATATSNVWEALAAVPARLRPASGLRSSAALAVNANKTEAGSWFVATDGRLSIYRAGEIQWAVSTTNCGGYYGQMVYIL